jgi:drug/metabolite transporter (DMT)-like permease
MARQILLKEFSPFFLSALSLSIVGILFLACAIVTRSLISLTRREVGLLVLSASIGLIANQILLFKGLQQTTATHAALIFTMSPLMTAGLAAGFLKETITWRMIAGCLVATSGLTMALNMQGIKLNAGDWMMLGATFTFSCNLIFVRLLSRRLSPFIITVYSFAISSFFFDPFVLSLTPIVWNHSVLIWGLAIGSILMVQGLTNVWWNKGMQTLGAARAVMVLNLQPLMTMLLDFIIFRHIFTFQQMFGASLVFAGVLFGTLKKGFFKRNQKPDITSKQIVRQKI